MSATIYVLAIAVLVGIPLYGARHGAASALGVGIALLIEIGLAALLVPPFAHGHPLGALDQAATVAAWQFIFLLPALLLAFPLGHYLQRVIPVSVDPFESIVGFVIGCCFALFTAHMLLGNLVQAYQGQPTGEEMERMAVVRQLVHLDGWHGLVNWVTTLDTPPEGSVPHNSGVVPR